MKPVGSGNLHIRSMKTKSNFILDTNKDSWKLPNYNAILDKNLTQFFFRPNMEKHLQSMGLIKIYKKKLLKIK